MPAVAIDALRSGDISPRAFALLAHLADRRQPGGWAWASNAFLAGQLGCSADTIIRAARQLVRVGLVERHQVPAPDPDDRANRTGWRWRFLFLEPDAGPATVQPTQACTDRKIAVPASVAVPQPCIGAGVAAVPPNPEPETRERSIDRPSSDRGGEESHEERSPALTPGVVDRAIEIAQEAGQAAFSQDLGIDRQRTAMRVAGQEAAFLAAVGATASRIGGAGKGKPIRDPMGYCFRTFADYLARGVPADPVFRPKAKLGGAPVPATHRRPVDPPGPPPSRDLIWGWRARGAPAMGS